MRVTLGTASGNYTTKEGVAGSKKEGGDGTVGVLRPCLSGGGVRWKG